MQTARCSFSFGKSDPETTQRAAAPELLFNIFLFKFDIFYKIEIFPSLAKAFGPKEVYDAWMSSLTDALRRIVDMDAD